ncbi:PREDICTED: uncharacterized protein LOC108552542, partial [Eufriesea mexicana]|uniref:uncharacterized protein LOC108552542 n=1 Tax=Eufriesea mexicana TaxID=516756 RepID=UPI00083C14E8
RFVGVLDKIKAGLEYATNYLETAKDIADLVAKSLDRNQEKRRGEGEDGKKSETFGPSNVVSAFFRLLGLDSQKITAIAVNSVIFLAQMVRIRHFARGHGVTASASIADKRVVQPESHERESCEESGRRK